MEKEEQMRYCEICNCETNNFYVVIRDKDPEKSKFICFKCADLVVEAIHYGNCED